MIYFRYEAVILLSLYALYIVIMYFNVSLEKYFVEKMSCCNLPAKDELNQLMSPKGEKTPMANDADNNADESGELSDRACFKNPEQTHAPVILFSCFTKNIRVRRREDHRYCTGFLGT